MAVFIILLLISSATLQPVSTNTNNCNGQELSEVPGLGWDILTSTPMKRVLVNSYSKDNCSKTMDGKYLLPDNMAEMIHKTLTVTAEVLEEPKYNTGLIKILIPDSHIEGIYSDDFKRLKKEKMVNGTTTMQIQVKIVKYRLSAEISAGLDEGFKKRILQALAAIGRNETNASGYLMELLVRDYGTHVVVRTDIGAKLVVEDYLDGRYARRGHQVPLKVTGLQCFAEEHLWEDRPSAVNLNEYRKNRLWTSLRSVGGNAKNGSLMLLDWLGGVQENLKVVDRKTVSLMDFMYSHKFPGVRPELLKELRKKLQTAIETYYKKNVHEGCTDLASPNFDFKNNVNNIEECSGSSESYSFGGIYETCGITRGTYYNLCTGKNINNPMTGMKNCPTGYAAKLFQSFPLAKQYWDSEPVKSCSGWGIFKKCRTEHKNVLRVTEGIHYIYWCGAKGQEQPLTLFGGMYSPSQNNPVTKLPSCAPNHQKLAGVDEGRHGITICGSGNLKDGYKNSVLFGGIIPECKSYGCPKNYKTFLGGTVANKCTMYYCAQGVPLIEYNDSYDNVTRPPYTKIVKNGTDVDYEYDYYYYDAGTTEDYWSEETTTETASTGRTILVGNVTEDSISTRNSIEDFPQEELTSTEEINKDYSTSTEEGITVSSVKDNDINNVTSNSILEFPDVVANKSSDALVNLTRNDILSAIEELEQASHSASAVSSKESKKSFTVYLVIGGVVGVIAVGILLFVYFKTRKSGRLFQRNSNGDSVQMDLVSESEDVQE